MFKNKHKMEYGYIDQKKKQLLLYMIGIALVGVAFFLFGLVLNKGDLANIFSVVAILFVIPAARYLTVWVVLAPYKSPSKDAYKEMKEYVEGHGLLITDLVFTSTERPMQLEYMVLAGEHAYCYKKPLNIKDGKQPTRDQLDKRRKFIKTTEEYLNKHFETEKLSYHAKIWEDETAFRKAIKSHTLYEGELDKQLEVKKTMEYFMV